MRLNAAGVSRFARLQDPMDAADVSEGVAVCLGADAAVRGTVIRRTGMRVRVDFSASGGSPSKWVQCKDLAPDGDAPPPPAPAPAPPDQGAAAGGEAGAPATPAPETGGEGEGDGVAPKPEPEPESEPVDAASASAAAAAVAEAAAEPEPEPVAEPGPEPAAQKPAAAPSAEPEAFTAGAGAAPEPATPVPAPAPVPAPQLKPARSPAPAPAPAAATPTRSGGPTAAQKMARKRYITEAKMKARTMTVEGEPFKTAVEHLKEAAAADKRYKDAGAGKTAEMLAGVIAGYTGALRLCQIAVDCPETKSGAKAPLGSKMDTVVSKLTKFTRQLPEDVRSALETQLASEAAAATAQEEANYESLMATWDSSHGFEPKTPAAATPPAVPASQQGGKAAAPPRSPRASGGGKKAAPPVIPSRAVSPKVAGAGAAASTPASAAAQTPSAAGGEGEGGPIGGLLSTPLPSFEPPPPVRRAPIERAPYVEPPPMETGLLYRVGDARAYLDSAVLPALSAALDDLALRQVRVPAPPPPPSPPPCAVVTAFYLARQRLFWLRNSGGGQLTRPRASAARAARAVPGQSPRRQPGGARAARGGRAPEGLAELRLSRLAGAGGARLSHTLAARWSVARWSGPR
jgi:hypothetical protein